MKFTDIFIQRPVLAVCISLLIVLLGIQSLSKLQLRQYPEMTNTIITVDTQYYGADSATIQSLISQPLEQAIAQSDNIDYMTSDSTLGSSKITVYMKLNSSPSAAQSNVLAQVSSVRSKLPSNALDPSVTMSTASGTSVIYMSFLSDVLNTSQITDYLQRIIQPRLYTIAGVAKVNLIGGTEFALRIWLDPDKMAANKLTASEVVNTLQSNNFQAAPGQTNGYYTLFNTVADTELRTPERLEELVIATLDHGVVRLKDIATVSLSKNHDVIRTMTDGKNNIIVSLDATPTANILNIASDVQAMLPEIKQNLPDTIKMQVTYDSTIAINDSIDDVIKTLLEAVLIVLIVITVFMGNMRAVIIPIITIPLSLIGVLLVMQLFGFSINLMTLLAMVLAIGLVVDDAIVVVENVDRHIKLGETPFQAAIMGTREIALPVISMTITLAAVYSPIALMGGITGALFAEFALTLAGAVVISGIIALTLSPMMSSKMLKQESEGRFQSFINKQLIKLNHSYETVLDNVFLYRPVILGFALLIFLALPVLFHFIPSELAPEEDNGVFLLQAKAPSNANLDYINNNLIEVSKILKSDPDIFTNITIAGSPEANYGFGVAPLKPWKDRERSQKEIIKAIKPALDDIPAMKISVFPTPELPGVSSTLPIQFVIKSPGSKEALLEVTKDAYQLITNNPQIVYADMDLAFDSATVKINVNRDAAGVYGVSMKAIGQTIGSMMNDAYINLIDINGRSYQIITQVERKFRISPDSIKNYYVKSQSGDMIALAALVNLEITAKPKTIKQFDQLNAATIRAVPAPGYSIGEAVAFIENDVVPTLPAGYLYSYTGVTKQYVEEGNALYYTFVFAILIIFLVLSAQFESMRDPLVILIAVPLAISGALVSLAWGMATLNIYTQVGLITLVGLISKHGILICEVAKENQLLHKMSRIDAVKHAAAIRMRPVVMTTAAMIAGLVPLLFTSGPGAVSRFGIGLVIVSGLFVGTLFTLFVLPVIYSFIASEHEPLQKFIEKA